MEEGATRTCQNCGAAVKEGASFCTRCGAAVAPAEGAASSPPPRETPPVPPAGAPQPTPPGEAEAVPQAAPPPPGVPAAERSRIPLLIGIMGVLLFIAGGVLLMLFLTVWSVGGEEEDGQVELARRYMNALQDEDPQAYLGCIDPQYFMDMGLAGDEAEEMIEGYFKMLKVRFVDVKLALDESSEGRSLVVTTAGTLRIGSLDYSGEIDLAEEPVYFYMVKKDGRWYLEGDPIDQVMGLDEEYDEGDGLDLLPEDFNLEIPEEFELDLKELEELLEDMDLEELEEWLKLLEDEEIPVQV